MSIQVLSSSRSQILAWNRIWREDGPGQAKCLVQVHQAAGLALCPCFIGLRSRWCSECGRMAHQREGHKRENEIHIDNLSQARKILADIRYLQTCSATQTWDTAALQQTLFAKQCDNFWPNGRKALFGPRFKNIKTRQHKFFQNDTVRQSQVGNEHFLYHPLQELFSQFKEIPERHASVSWSWAISPWKDSMNPDESWKPVPGKALSHALTNGSSHNSRPKQTAIDIQSTNSDVTKARTDIR